MKTIRRDMGAITAGLFAAVVVAVLIDGHEFVRVRNISLAYGHSYQDSIVIFVLVVASTFTFTALALVALSCARGEGTKSFVVVSAIALSIVAAFPVYWYVYRDAPPGWHINIAEEHMWAPPAGVAAALLTYGIAHLFIRALRNRRAKSAVLAGLPN